MEMKKLMQKIWDEQSHQYWKFIAENDHKSCPVCKEFDGTTFRDDDPDLPKLPLHPNCRCIMIPVNKFF